MTPDPSESQESRRQAEDESEFARALQETEQLLTRLKDRYEQIERDRQRQAELSYRREEIRQQVRRNPLPELKEELQQIQQELETIELNLESSLFTWGSLKEPFWQAIRFGGLGILIGWILKSWVG